MANRVSTAAKGGMYCTVHHPHTGEMKWGCVCTQNKHKAYLSSLAHVIARSVFISYTLSDYHLLKLASHSITLLIPSTFHPPSSFPPSSGTKNRGRRPALPTVVEGSQTTAGAAAEAAEEFADPPEISAHVNAQLCGVCLGPVGGIGADPHLVCRQ